jgi:hypothetical protein
LVGVYRSGIAAKTNFAAANLPFHLIKNKLLGRFGQKYNRYGLFFLINSKRVKNSFFRNFAA